MREEGGSKTLAIRQEGVDFFWNNLFDLAFIEAPINFEANSSHLKVSVHVSFSYMYIFTELNDVIYDLILLLLKDQ